MSITSFSTQRAVTKNTLARPTINIFAVVACIVVFATSMVQITQGQVFDERFDDWPIDLKINGRIIAVDSQNLVTSLEPWLSEAENNRARERDDAPETPAAKRSILVLHSEELAEETKELYQQWFTQVDLLPLADLVADDLSLACNVIAWHDDRTASEFPEEMLTSIQPKLSQFVDQGGCLALIGNHTPILSKVFIADQSGKHPSVGSGLNLLPDCCILPKFDDSTSDTNQLASLLASHPSCVGIGLDSETAIVLDGRKLQVAGQGSATLMLTANERQPRRIQTIKQRGSWREDPEQWLVDLTQWRRDAIDRTLEPFPPMEPREPKVENGTLIIVGGGGMPEDLMDQFVEFAGGIEAAKLVYVPCEEADEVSENQGIVRMWKRMGVEQATYIHTKDRNKANEDETILSPLREATGIWFGGGRQWNFADSYYGTTAHKLMKEVLARGGVIGGSSAGASIQGRYLARATPIQNFKIMAFGYERGGLGFLDGVAIDQHFSQRGRQKDMTQLVNRYPQLLGIGLDEATAITVQGSIAKVTGRGKVHFYDRNQPVYPDRLDYIALEKGKQYDLEKRQIITPEDQIKADILNEAESK